ncbi:MAG: DUF2868 domain-containing protein [Comamonadaceae bacterium]|nr:MAG: DUF2868 domain-containing protein [Comamonadaceae bacterium]
MLNPAWRDTAFTDAVLTESVRWVEEAGPLDDSEAVRSALSRSSDAPGRIALRARALGERIGLQAELGRMRQWAPWVLLAMVALIVFAGLGVAGNVVGGGERRINVMVALVSLLGLHALTLILWLVGLALPAGSLHASLGALWLTLTARVAGGKRGQAPVLLRATTGLLNHARLTPWAFGFVSHTIWTLSFAVVLAALLFALAFRNYTLNWETTILEPGFFVRSVALLGIAPGWFGFPVPDAAMVLTPNQGLAAQRTWALWLTGCVVVYGLLPRLLLAVLSAGVWQARKRKLQPDLALPYYRKLAARFDALQAPVVLDADPGRPLHGAPVGLPAERTQDALWLIGFELPDDLAWPPADLRAAAAQTLRIDGSASERSDALDALAQGRPARVVLACHAAASPDRGTERFVREVQSHCGECRIWLIGSEATPGRWQRWLADAGLGTLRATDRATDALEGWA